MHRRLSLLVLSLALSAWRTSATAPATVPVASLGWEEVPLPPDATLNLTWLVGGDGSLAAMERATRSALLGGLGPWCRPGPGPLVSCVGVPASVVTKRVTGLANPVRGFVPAGRNATTSRAGVVARAVSGVAQRVLDAAGVQGVTGLQLGNRLHRARHFARSSGGYGYAATTGFPKMPDLKPVVLGVTRKINEAGLLVVSEVVVAIKCLDGSMAEGIHFDAACEQSHLPEAVVVRHPSSIASQWSETSSNLRYSCAPANRFVAPYQIDGSLQILCVLPVSFGLPQRDHVSTAAQPSTPPTAPFTVAAKYADSDQLHTAGNLPWYNKTWSSTTSPVMPFDTPATTPQAFRERYHVPANWRSPSTASKPLNFTIGTTPAPRASLNFTIPSTTVPPLPSSPAPPPRTSTSRPLGIVILVDAEAPTARSLNMTAVQLAVNADRATQLLPPLELDAIEALLTVEGNTPSPKVPDTLEASLDVQYGMSLGSGVPVCVYVATYGVGSAPTYPEALVQWAKTAVSGSLSGGVTPAVWSISYGGPVWSRETPDGAALASEFNGCTSFLQRSLGVLVVAASGDTGATFGPIHAKSVMYPAGAERVLSVGGTGVTLGQDGRATSEVPMSALQGHVATTGAGAIGFITVPRMCALGTGYRVYFRGEVVDVAGTSGAAVAVAASLASLQLVPLKTRKTFDVSGAYDWIRAAVLQDLDEGSNCAGALTSVWSNELYVAKDPATCQQAAPGFDPLTGWGTINFTALLHVLELHPSDIEEMH